MIGCMILGFVYTVRRRRLVQRRQVVEERQEEIVEEEREEEKEEIESPIPARRKKKKSRRGRIRFTNLDPQATMPINSKEPIEFENDRVKGRCLLMIRPPDPRHFVHAKHFEGRRRRFELQVQIQFKKIPTGKVFMGGQLREPMTLGFIMRSIGMTLLSVVKTLVPGGGKLHHSFGSSSERPHIAFPFRQAVAAMVITKENEKAPVLGGDIVESPVQRKQRRSGVVPEWNLTDTYVFVFK